MSKRIILAVYCLALACCCVWVPWSITSSDKYETSHERLGYGWVWAGPRYPRWMRQQGQYSPKDVDPVADNKSSSEQKPVTPDFSDIDQFVATESKEEAARDRWDTRTPLAAPDLRVIAFQVIAVSLVAVAGIFLTKL